MAAAPARPARTHQGGHAPARPWAATAARLASSGPVTPDEASGPPPDRDPVHVAAWWHGLSPAQRRTLLDRHPELVGDLDGVPATDRDVANRVRLARLLADPGTPHR